jgi:hypothetical protein
MSGGLVDDDVVVGILSSWRNLSKKSCAVIISELPLFSGGAKSRLTPKGRFVRDFIFLIASCNCSCVRLEAANIPSPPALR